MYNGSQVLTADMSLVYSSNYKDSLLEDSQKSRGVFMDSEIDHNLAQNQQSSSGLLRFRSAPSSLLVNFTNACASAKLGDSLEGFLSSPGFQDFKGNSREKLAADGTIVDQRRGPQSGYAGGSDPQLPPHYPRQSSVSKGGSICSNLSRQSSSPPGLFKNPTAQNGYAAMRGLGNGRVGGGDGEGANGEPNPSASRLKGQISYLSGLPSSLGLLSQISELGSESIAASSRDGGKIGNIEGSNQFYSPGISFGSWSGSAGFQENFNCVKRDPDDDGKLFSRNGELGNGMQVLSHHLSLLKTPAEITAMDKFLQFSDSVPCKVRAKRGCATHPRSIAERVRRSRISERMRKLQDLVPNMEKQTNTADMLDLAVEYIKNLQRQYKALSSNLANCKCSGLQTTVANDIV